MKKTLTFLSLFTSSATLVCCALPALLVTLGAGAALAGLVGNFPQLVWFSENKTIVFAIGGSLLFAAGLFRYYAKKKSCPIDDERTSVCQESRDISFWIYLASIGIYAVGAFFAYAAPYLL